MTEPIRFDGQVIAITGAGRGLGAPYARLIAARGGDFDALLESLRASWRPANALEELLVKRLARAVWRIAQACADRRSEIHLVRRSRNRTALLCASLADFRCLKSAAFLRDLTKSRGPLYCKVRACTYLAWA